MEKFDGMDALYAISEQPLGVAWHMVLLIRNFWKEGFEYNLVQHQWNRCSTINKNLDRELNKVSEVGYPQRRQRSKLATIWESRNDTKSPVTKCCELTSLNIRTIRNEHEGCVRCVFFLEGSLNVFSRRMRNRVRNSLLSLDDWRKGCSKAQMKGHSQVRSWGCDVWKSP